MKKDCVPYGSDVSAGQFKCADCGKVISMASKTSLPPCPNSNAILGGVHSKKCWIVIKGRGDSILDPYPNK